MPVHFKDYYATLGVPRRATEDEVKRAFRRLARKHHPDVAKDPRAAEERFKEINEAYEVLGNPAHRDRYDQLGPGWRDGSGFPNPASEGSTQTTPHGRGPGGAFEFEFGSTGFSDFFESLFGGRARRNARSGGTRNTPYPPEERGDDVSSEIVVALDEVLHGSVRTITQERVSGRTGRVERTGLQVRIPRGVQDGQLVRVASRGVPAPNGVPGDLLLRVRLAAHPDFRPSGSDLWSEVLLAPWEAVLGATVNVASLEGPLSVKVPAGSRNGQQLRVRGRGLPNPDTTRGDLYVVVVIEVPTSTTDEERALWKSLAATSPFHPRGT